MVYIVVSVVIIFIYELSSKKKTTTSLWNTEQIPRISLSPKHIKSIRLNPNISKYLEFGVLKVHGLDTKSNMTYKYATNFFIVIHHYKWEDYEIDTDQ